MSRIHLTSCTSTNDELSRRAADGAEAGTVLVADEQTAGRGRGDHRWYSPPGDLFASILLRPEVDLARVAAVSLVVGISVANALREFGVDAQLTWPNDVVVGTRKIAGILPESSSRGASVEYVIAGIGVNVATRVYPEWLGQIATSIAIERVGPPPSRDEVLERIIGALDNPLERFVGGGVAAIRDEWELLWRDRGRVGSAKIDGRSVRGEVIGLTNDGHLALELPSGDRVAAVAGTVDIE